MCNVNKSYNDTTRATKLILISIKLQANFPLWLLGKSFWGNWCVGVIKLFFQLIILLAREIIIAIKSR